jgi:hypothetical protein
MSLTRKLTLVLGLTAGVGGCNDSATQAPTTASVGQAGVTKYEKVEERKPDGTRVIGLRPIKAGSGEKDE